MMLGPKTINRGLSASVRTSISQMQPMAGTMTHGGREPEKCIICFITYFLTCSLRKHINKTQIDNGVGRLLIWCLCPLALGFLSIRCKNTRKNTKKTQITNPTINGDVSTRVRISINQMQPTVAAPSPPAHFVITCVLIIPFIHFVIVFTYILGFHPFC